MKILFICQNFYPENFRVNDVCSRLVKDGNDVVVLTGYPNYPEGKFYKGYARGHQKENIFGATVYRTKIIARHHGFFMRFFNYVSFAYSGIRKIRRIKKEQHTFDVIFVFQMAPVCQIYPGIKAKKIFKVPLISYCCDPWPEQVKIGGISSGPLYKLVWDVSKKMYRESDIVINASPSFVDYNHTVNCVPYEKMAYLMQHCNDLPSWRDLVKAPNGFVDLLFIGNVGKFQDLQTVITAISLSHKKNLRLHVVGDGSCQDDCISLSAELGLTNQVLFYGRKAREELPEFYKQADACLLPLSLKTSVGMTMPSKLTEYMAAGKTIVGVCGGDAANLIKKEGLGPCVEPDDPQRIADFLASFCDHVEDYRDCGSRCRKYYERYGTLDYWALSFYKIVNSEIQHYRKTGQSRN
jgi:glycosyltransferase involved in cell wall biosynthesis